MEWTKRQAPEVATLLEVVLQVHGELRKRLDPIRVTPLQAGATVSLESCGGETRGGISTLRVNSATLSEVVKDLVRNRWVTQRRSVMDTRAVCLSLTGRG